jgi:DtxR family transcriptional regulator, Mn-dependent transcriptional regulator
MTRSVAPRDRYLQIVAERAEEGRQTRQADICRRLDRTPPTICQTTERLAGEGLVLAHTSRVELTAAGRRLASTILRRHRLLECLLHEVVGVEWWRLPEEAARLQPVLGERVAETMLPRLLRRPHRSPFGCAVPYPAGSTPTPTSATLTTVCESSDGPHRVVVLRVGEQLRCDSDALRRLHEAGVIPGAVVTVARETPGRFAVTCGDRTLALDAQSADGLAALVSLPVPTPV